MRLNKAQLPYQYNILQEHTEFLSVQPQLTRADFGKFPWILLIPHIILIPFEKMNMDTISLFKKKLAEYQTRYNNK